MYPNELWIHALGYDLRIQDVDAISFFYYR
jgi:hypothetical protein